MAASTLLIASTVVSTGASIYNAYNQSQAGKARGKYEQQVAERNARALELRAEDVLRIGYLRSARTRGAGRALVGRQRVALAGQGVNVNTATGALLQEEARTISEFDAMTIENNAWREAWGFRIAADDERSKGRFARFASKNEAKNTILTGGLNAVTDIGRTAFTLRRT